MFSANCDNSPVITVCGMQDVPGYSVFSHSISIVQLAARLYTLDILIAQHTGSSFFTPFIKHWLATRSLRNRGIPQLIHVGLSRFRLIKIKGKRGRRVPVLLSKDMERGVETIIQCQKTVLKKSSPYIFQLPGHNGPLTGWAALKKVAAEIPELEQPEAITSTNVRKYVATVSQVRPYHHTDQ